jgi:hypothetical protein
MLINLFNAKVGDRIQIKNESVEPWAQMVITIVFNNQEIKARCCAACQGVVEFYVTSVETVICAPEDVCYIPDEEPI